MNFEFELGEFVRCVSDNPLGPDNKATYQVIERTTQECPAGIQTWYTCRGHHKRYEGRVLSTQLIKFNAIELEAIPEKEQQSEVEEMKEQLQDLIRKIGRVEKTEQ